MKLIFITDMSELSGRAIDFILNFLRIKNQMKIDFFKYLNVIID